MSNIVSAGILLKSGNHYLIGGTSKDINSTHGWGIPKGKIEPGETLLETAIREFYEETSLALTNFITEVELSTKPIKVLKYKIKKGTKEVHVFSALDKSGKLIDHDFKCLTFTEKGNPELASFLWLPKEEAYAKVMKSQKELFI